MLRRAAFQVLFLKRIRYSSSKSSLSKKESIQSKKIELPYYSRDGDDGFSELLTGVRIPKDNPVFTAIGAAEELNSLIGCAREFAQDSEHEYIDKLKRVQMCIIDITSAISRSGSENNKIIPELYTKELEEWIHEYCELLPPAEHFIIPGGGKASSSLHLARSSCRKTERYVVTLVRNGKLDKGAQVYLNRLSDFLFVISRLAAKYDKRSESIYIPIPVETQTSQ